MAFGQKSIIGSLEFKRNLDGFFLGLPTARNLWRKSFFIWPLARNQSSDHRNLYGYYGYTELWRAESPMASLAQGNTLGGFVLFSQRPVRTKVITW